MEDVQQRTEKHANLRNKQQKKRYGKIRNYYGKSETIF